jgi:hypothetical protein
MTKKVLKQVSGTTLIVAPDSTRGFIGGTPHIHPVFLAVDGESNIRMDLRVYSKAPVLTNGYLSAQGGDTDNRGYVCPMPALTYNNKISFTENMHLVCLAAASEYLKALNPEAEFSIVEIEEATPAQE